VKRGSSPTVKEGLYLAVQHPRGEPSLTVGLLPRFPPVLIRVDPSLLLMLLLPTSVVLLQLPIKRLPPYAERPSRV
jgi:hypothetical protein